MEKYHKEIGFLPCHVKEAQTLIEALQGKRIAFSSHSLKELNKEKDNVKIGQFLVNYCLNWNDVFELAFNAGKLEKIGFRANFNEKDIVFILSRDKMIITLWTNNKNDGHFTLNKNNYVYVISEVLTTR